MARRVRSSPAQFCSARAARASQTRVWSLMAAFLACSAQAEAWGSRRNMPAAAICDQTKARSAVPSFRARPSGVLLASMRAAARAGSCRARRTRAMRASTGVSGVRAAALLAAAAVAAAAPALRWAPDFCVAPLVVLWVALPVAALCVLEVAPLLPMVARDAFVRPAARVALVLLRAALLRVLASCCATVSTVALWRPSAEMRWADGWLRWRALRMPGCMMAALRKGALAVGTRRAVAFSSWAGLFRARSRALASGGSGSRATAWRISAGLLISRARFRRCWRWAGVSHACSARVCSRAVQLLLRAWGCSSRSVACRRVAAPGCLPSSMRDRAERLARHSGALSSFRVQAG